MSSETREQTAIPDVGERGDGRLALLVFASSGIEFDLSHSSPLLIGRSAEADVVIDDGTVSRQHARLIPGAQGPVLTDLGSRNGTLVNGVPVGPDGVVLKAGDAVHFGGVPAAVYRVRPRRAEEAVLVQASELDVVLAEEADRCIRLGHTVSVVAIELTGTGGDRNQAAAALLARHLRAIDVVATRGLGELAVLLRETDKANAHQAACRLETVLARAQMPARLGVAVFPDDAPSCESLITAACTAMRRATPGSVTLASEAARVLRLGTRSVVIADPAMVRLFALVERAASMAMAVLITGETGSGKEIVAEALHALGPRAGMPLVKVSCAAIPENLLESELFGYEPGAFSGAGRAKRGLIEAAEGGTLFLDEIGEASAGVQAKLLRVLEEHRVRRLGAVEDRATDARIVAATNRDLKHEVAGSKFREDLFYRLSALVLAVPALRDRRGEIRILAERFAAEASRAIGRSAIGLSQEAAASLLAYPWPGNVRQLWNVICSAVIACDTDAIDVQHLPPELPRPPSARDAPAGAPSALSLDEEVRAFTRRRIVEALEACGGNQTAAARLLGLPRRTLVSKLVGLGIKPSRPRSGR